MKTPVIFPFFSMRLVQWWLKIRIWPHNVPKTLSWWIVEQTPKRIENLRKQTEQRVDLQRQLLVPELILSTIWDRWLLHRGSLFNGTLHCVIRRRSKDCQITGVLATSSVYGKRPSCASERISRAPACTTHHLARRGKSKEPTSRLTIQCNTC